MGDNAPRNIGLPMLIVVLVSICLFSFGGIAFSTARRSYKQSSNLMERTNNYYGACNEAERMLSSLSEIPEEETTYSFPFGMSMEELQVTIRPDEKGGYMITGWVISDTASWEAPVGLGEDGSGGGPSGPAAPSGGPAAPSGGPAAPSE